VFDPVLPEQQLDASGQALDDLVLTCQNLLQVQRDLAGGDAVAGNGLAGLLVAMRDVQQLLGRDAAYVEAGAAEAAALLDAGGLEAELGRPDCRDIATRAAADDDEVEGISHGSALPPFRRGRSRLPVSRIC